VTAWKWLFVPRKKAPHRVRVHLVPDSGQESIQWNVPFAYFRVLAVLLALGFLSLLFLIFSSGSLFLEKQRRQILEHRLDEMTQRVAHVHSLENQLGETTLVLMQIQSMLGIREDVPDSLLAGMVARETLAGESLSLLSGDLSEQGQQMLEAAPGRWPVSGWVTREYLGRRGPDYHPGIDIAAEEGQPVVAAGDGVVLVAGWNEEYGNFVLIDHSFGITSLYAHNSSLAVRKEDRVRGGDVIAFVGDTGHSTGPHLHFEVRRNGIPVDPRIYLLH